MSNEKTKKEKVMDLMGMDLDNVNLDELSQVIEVTPAVNDMFQQEGNINLNEVLGGDEKMSSSNQQNEVRVQPQHVFVPQVLPQEQALFQQPQQQIQQAPPQQQIQQAPPQQQVQQNYQTQALQPQQQYIPQQAFYQPPQQVQNNPFNFDMSALKVPGLVVGEIQDLEVSRFAVERIKFNENNRSMINLLLNKAVGLKTHYNKKAGSYLCFGGSCCKHDGLPKIRYVFPVIEYDTNKAGVPITKEIKYKVLSVGKDTNEDIKALTHLHNDITSIDLFVVCKDSNFQKISIMPAPGSCRWRMIPDLLQKTQNFWAEHIQDFYTAVARSITEAEYRSYMEADGIGGSVASTFADSSVNMKDVFGGM